MKIKEAAPDTPTNRPETAAGLARRLLSFLWAYVRSMRLYYAFITGIAGWIGVAYAHFLHPDSVSPWRSALVIAILFLSWGINQIVNDYLGLKEDRINAPHRPMVTGELPPFQGLALSGALIGVSLWITWSLSPWATVPFCAGILFNVLYEFAKGVPYLGNVVFGIMIASCTAYGFLAAPFEPDLLLTPARLAVLVLVAVMNGLMTFYTYFKDRRGDEMAGKVTAVVLHGIRRARIAALLFGPLPTAALGLFLALGVLAVPASTTFLLLVLLTLVLQAWTGLRYFLRPEGRPAYDALATNFRACAGGQASLIALFHPMLALGLFAVSYVLIGLIFDLHSDSLA